MTRYPTSWRATLIWCGVLYLIAVLLIAVLP